MTASINTGVTSANYTEQSVSSLMQHKPIKIKDVYHRRIEAMRSLNADLAANVTFFNSFNASCIEKDINIAKDLHFDLWFHGNKELIRKYLIKKVGGSFYSIKKEKRGRIVELLHEFIIDRNRIYFATTLDHQEINRALIRGNLTQDFLFLFIEDHLNSHVAFLFKKHIRPLIRAITIIQYGLIQREKSQAGFLVELVKKKEQVIDLDRILDYFNVAFFGKSILKLVHKKLKKESVRSSFARWTFEHFKAQLDYDVDPQINTFLNKDFPLLIEIAMCIMYYDNQVLDSKGDIKKLKGIKENLLARTFLKDLCFDYVEEKLSDKKQQQLVTHHLQKIFSSVDVGQHLDKSWNTFQQFEDKNFFYNGLSERLFENLWPNPKHVAWLFMKTWIKDTQFWINYEPFLEVFEEIRKKNWTKSNHLDLYLDRIFLTNSALFLGIVELSGALMDYTGKEKEKLSMMAIGYGMSLQIVNDYADFIPIPWYYARDNKTVEKKASDIYKDLLNNTMSLPLLIHLAGNDKNSIIYRLIKLKPFRIKRIQRFKLQKELYSSQALKDCVVASQRMVRIFNKRQQFKLDRSCLASMFLRDLPSICFYNRFNTERMTIEQNFAMLEKFEELIWEIKSKIRIQIKVINKAIAELPKYVIWKVKSIF